MNRLLALAVPLLIAVPAIAQDAGGGGRSWNASQTKAEAEQRADLIFGQLDANHDGFITQDEVDGFKRAMAGNTRMIDRVTKMFAEADANHDGKLSSAEARAHADAAFDAADANHDGVLTPEERQAARAAAGGGQPPK